MENIPIAVSNSHVHLCASDMEVLFGPMARLRPIRALSQPGQFISNRIVYLHFLNKIKQLVVVGPLRENSSIELTFSDAVEVSKDPLELTGDLCIVGTHGRILLNGTSKLTVMERHIHITEEKFREMGFSEDKRISVAVQGSRRLTYHNVRVKIDKNAKLEFHIDKDEARAAGIRDFGEGVIVK